MKIIYLISVFRVIFMVQSVLAQDIGAWPGKNGIFVNYAKDLPKGFSFKLERQVYGENNWRTIQQAVVPKNLLETRSQILMALAKNPFYGMPRESEIAHFWEKLRKSSTIDSLYTYAASPLFLEVAGVGFFDTQIQPGVQYVYRVSEIGNKNRQIKPVIFKPQSFPGKVQTFNNKFIAVQATGSLINLQWKFDKNNHPFGIKVFRENYLQTNFQEITPDISFIMKTDSVIAEITDKNVAERMTYRYTVIPFDYFGNEAKPTEAVLVVNIKPYGDAVVLKKFVTISDPKGHGIGLSWAYKDKKQLTGIMVFRSDSMDLGFKKIADLPPTDTFYLDRGVIPVKSYYYFLVFNNVYGQSPPTVKVIGMLKPNKNSGLPPQQVSLRALPEGNKIMWKRTEPDTKGYYVYRSNGYNGELKQHSPFIQPDSVVSWYLDKKENLIPGMAYSYAVVAVNSSSNISPVSTRVCANPVPQTLPVPLNLHYLKQGKAVILIWDDFRKNLPQVIGYRVYRAEITNTKTLTDFKTIDSRINSNSYTDTTIKAGVHYVYAVSALGYSDTESPKSQTIAFFIAPPKPFPPAGLRVIPTSKEILIHWDAIASSDVKEYKLYREVSKGKPKLLATFKPANTNYTDSSVDKGETYYYKVTTVNLKGEESEKSDEVGVVVTDSN